MQTRVEKLKNLLETIQGNRKRNHPIQSQSRATSNISDAVSFTSATHQNENPVLKNTAILENTAPSSTPAKTSSEAVVQKKQQPTPIQNLSSPSPSIETTGIHSPEIISSIPPTVTQVAKVVAARPDLKTLSLSALIKRSLALKAR